MVAQASWLDSDDLEQDTGSEDEELWHVMLAPDEVKVLTLEQLDDLFRLDIIDARTPVWQPATMSSWTTLGAVAGIDWDDADSEAEPTRAAPPPPARDASLRAVPPPPGQLERYGGASTSTQSVTPPILHVVRPPAPPAAPAGRRASGVPPAPVLSRSAPPPAPRAAPVRSQGSGYPPPVAPVVVGSYPPPVAAYVQAPVDRSTLPPRSRARAQAAPAYAAPTLETLRPMAADIPVGPHRARGGIGIEGWLIGLAAVAGLTVTLYRNDTLRTTALDAGREPLFAQLETALGGPSFGTMRAIEELTDSAVPASGPGHVPTPAIAPAAPLPAAAAPLPAAAAPVPDPAAPVPDPATTAPVPDPAKNAVRLEDLGTKPAEAKTSTAVAPSRPAARTASRTAAPRPAKTPAAAAAPTPVKRSKKHASSMYDPLNPEL